MGDRLPRAEGETGKITSVATRLALAGCHVVQCYIAEIGIGVMELDRNVHALMSETLALMCTARICPYTILSEIFCGTGRVLCNDGRCSMRSL